jgi:hypothetical protein
VTGFDTGGLAAGTIAGCQIAVGVMARSDGCDLVWFSTELAAGAETGGDILRGRQTTTAAAATQQRMPKMMTDFRMVASGWLRVVSLPPHAGGFSL